MPEPTPSTPAQADDLVDAFARAIDRVDEPHGWNRERIRAALFGAGAARAPRTIAHYEILGVLGEGAMGVVLEAHDPRLDRRAAIKLLSSRGSSEQATARMLREAQALARLSHPNVVQVYEVDTTEDGQVFIAMELVEGRTLRRWQRERPRPWQEHVEHIVQAAQGLSAAHAQGLVHRDFKPDNCIVGADGRVRVLDFGLARAWDDATQSMPKSPSGAAEDHRSLTRSGALVGTFEYMALELLEGDPAGPQGDQFALCVTLFEGVYGRLPFAGRTVQARGEALRRGLEGVPRVDTRGRRVPARLRAVLRRGLAARPEDRFESMDALLQGLRRTLSRPRWPLVVAAAAVLGGAAVLGSDREAAACEGMAEHEVPGWSAARREAVARAWESSSVPHARVAWPLVARRLDAHAAALRSARQRACEATHVEGSASPGDEQRAYACLDRYGRSLDAMTRRLQEAEAVASPTTPEAVEHLPEPHDCAGAGALLRGPLPREADRERAARIQEDGARALVLGRTGAADAGLVLADVVLEQARALAHPPTVADALLVRGRLQALRGDRGQAGESFVEALTVAEGSAADQLALDVLHELAAVEIDRAHVSAARGWLSLAWAKLERTGDDAQRRIDLLRTQGGLDRLSGAPQAAAQSLEAALAAYAALDDPPTLGVASTHNDLANALEDAGRRVDARRQRRLALERLEPWSPHPKLARVVSNLAAMDLAEGRVNEARAGFERALALFSRYGDAGPTIAQTHLALATVELQRGDQAKAREHLDRAQTAASGLAAEALLQSDIVRLRAGLDQAAGDFEAAIAGYAQAVVLLRDAEVGRIEEPWLASNIGECLLALGQTSNARERFETALARLQQGPNPLPPDDPRLAYPLRGLAEAMIRQGEAATAVPHLERALALRRREPGERLNLAEIHWSRARARAALGHPADEVDNDVRAAEEALDGTGEAGQVVREQIERWRAGGSEVEMILPP